MNGFLHIEEISALNLSLMILGAAACLASYVLRLAAHATAFRKGSEALDFRMILVLNFLGYFGWGYWCGADPVKMQVPAAIAVPVGASLAAIGLGLFLYSELAKHGVGSTGKLVRTGIYARIRHPMYLGLVLLHLGFPFVFRSFIAWVSTILWAGFIAAWTRFEEKNLERRFGQDYLDYKRKTWF